MGVESCDRGNAKMPQPIEHDYEASCWLRKLQEVV
jgi:hypothetical protein